MFLFLLSFLIHEDLGWISVPGFMNSGRGGRSLGDRSFCYSVFLWRLWRSIIFMDPLICLTVLIRTPDPSIDFELVPRGSRHTGVVHTDNQGDKAPAGPLPPFIGPRLRILVE